MRDFDVQILLPATSGSLADETGELLGRMKDRNRTLSITCFVSAAEPDELRAQRAEITGLVRDAFDGPPPPVSVVTQAPEGGHRVAIEACILPSGDAEATLTRKECDGYPYSLITAPGLRQVHAGGLFAEDGTDTIARAETVFAPMAGILASEGLTFGHVIRQWNYIACMLEVENGGRQRYQDFNDVRSRWYDTSPFPTGYPAATGIGQVTGGIVIEFIALDAAPGVEVAAVSNPRQVDAHAYSEGVLIGEVLDKTSPKFERAKRVVGPATETVFVSGTASIIGEESVSIGDVAEQTKITLENIATLTPSGGLTSLRAYVKRSGDIPVVRSVCESTLGDIPALYVCSDVCRRELLVEIEGVSVTGRNAGATS